MPFDIPDSWEWVRIRSLGEIVRGSGIKRNETVRQGFPCVRYGELYTTYQTSFTKTVSFIAPDLYEKCKHFSYGDVLMTLTGENKPDIAKAVAYLGTEPIAAGGDLAFWTQHGMNPLYLSYIMASPYIIGRKVALATGDIIVHISGDKLGTILLPVPPLAEQERIVARIQEAELVIEKYAHKATALRELQDTFPEALKKSILQEAVQGKLVPQDPSDEPAEALLERIRAEKQRLIKEGKIKKDKHESIIFRRDNSHYEKLDGVERCIDDELPFEIPESWQWVRVRDCTALFNGRAFKPSDWTATGLPIVRIQNLNDEKALFNYFDKPVDEDVHLYGGELLFAWSGTPGTSFGAHIWRDEEAVLNQHIFKLLFDETAIFKPYYMYALNQRVGSLIKAAHGSAGLQHVTRGVFEATLVPLPPLAEQHRIVQRIEELLPMVQGL